MNMNMTGPASLEHTAQLPKPTDGLTDRLILRSCTSPGPAALVETAQSGQKVLCASLYVAFKVGTRRSCKLARDHDDAISVQCTQHAGPTQTCRRLEPLFFRPSGSDICCFSLLLLLLLMLLQSLGPDARRPQ